MSSLANWRRISSPTTCPYRSLAALKPLRSATSSENGCPLLNARFQLLLETAPVGETSERIDQSPAFRGQQASLVVRDLDGKLADGFAAFIRHSATLSFKALAFSMMDRRIMGRLSSPATVRRRSLSAEISRLNFSSRIPVDRRCLKYHQQKFPDGLLVCLLTFLSLIGPLGQFLIDLASAIMDSVSGVALWARVVADPGQRGLDGGFQAPELPVWLLAAHGCKGRLPGGKQTSRLGGCFHAHADRRARP